MRQLVIADKNLSSWSLRPWLALSVAGIDFAEVNIRLGQPDTRHQILRYSPSGKVPCLIDGRIVVWDSLAICEYAAELAPTLWPADAAARAEARAVSAEMHAGFAALRQNMPMEVCALKPGEGRTQDSEADIARILALWEACRVRHGAGGPFLFGAFSIADAMYAPVVWRFVTYAVAVPPVVRAWMDAMLALPAMQAWRAGAAAELAARPA
ncbi:glutathione S-transferase family protein [Azospira restricta]|uniref:Glutathione S-transferase family protein n=1 Tax=Azospira restricta TaxID=404405 RepID=A0A974Y479_9RHOO|nr:glutathione S-transferase family protein [Azospira restricta]QRJ64320.1 glutathione S-transferase family protein [Azospira restricta]